MDFVKRVHASVVTHSLK